MIISGHERNVPFDEIVHSPLSYSLRSLTLENFHYDEGYNYRLDSIVNFQNLTRIHFVHCLLKADDLATVLRDTPILREVHFKNSNVHRETVEDLNLFDVIGNEGSRLERLKVDCVGIKVIEYLTAFVAALSSHRSATLPPMEVNLGSRVTEAILRNIPNADKVMKLVQF